MRALKNAGVSWREDGPRRTALRALRFAGKKFGIGLDHVERRRLYLNRLLLKKYDGIVQRGPLAGMKLNPHPRWGNDSGSQIFGLYEHRVLEAIVKGSIGRSTFIDIGAADGYYGVGLVKGGYFARSLCFEIDLHSQRLLSQVAALNDVSERVEILGAAGTDIAEHLARLGVQMHDALILIDIEGAEFSLVDENFLRATSQSKIIIELHDAADPKGRELRRGLVSRAEGLFDVELIEGGPRDPSAITCLRDLSENDRWLICSEARAVSQTWLILTPK